MARFEGVFRRRGAAPILVETHAGAPIHAAERAAAGFLAVGGHVVVVNGVSQPDVRLALSRRIIDEAGRGSLSRADAFEAVRKRLPADADVLCYLAPADPASGDAPAPPFFVDIDLLLALAHADGPHRGAGLAARAERDRLAISSFTRFEDPAAALAVRPPAERARDAFLDRLPGEPFLALQMNMDPASLRGKLDALHPQDAADTTAADGAGGTGALGAQLVDAMTGRMGLLANRLAIMGSDVVLYAEGRRDGAITPLLDTLVAGLRRSPMALPIFGSTAGIEEDTEAGVAFYRLPLLPFAEVCAGVVSDHLVVTTTRDRMVRIIAGGPSFLAAIPDETVRAAIADGHAMSAYVDVAGFVSAIGMLPLPQAEPYRNAMDAVKMFDRVTAVGDVDAEGYATEVAVIALEPDVWPRLLGALIAAGRGRSS
jgi:hypothetical protein